jgi:hypothetical protein
MATTGPPDHERSLVETALSSARDAAFVVSIFLVFTGIVYRQRFFSSFDMPPSTAEGSLYLILLDAYQVLLDHALGVVSFTIIGVVIVVGISAALRRTRLPLPFSHGLLAAIGVVLIICCFPALATVAQDSADRQSAAVRGRFLIGSRIHVKAARVKDLPAGALLDPTAVTLMGQTDQDFFALYQPPPSRAHPNIYPDAEVYTIPRDAVDFIESDLVAASEQRL